MASRTRRVIDPDIVAPGGSPVASTLVRRLAAVGALVLIAMRISLPGDVHVGSLLAIAMVPLWWPVLRSYRSAKWLIWFTLAAVISGAWLTVFSSTDHATSIGHLLGVSVLIIGAACSIGVVLWSRRIMTDAQVAMAFGVGLLLGVSPGSGLFDENPWRFGFSVPVTVLLLAVAQRTGRRWLELVVTLALVLVSTLTDARSSFAILMMTALIIAWQMRPARKRRRSSAIRVAVGLAALAVIVYNFGQALILDGYLGVGTQQRSAEQAEAAGSLLIGGRPEAAATLALMQHQPWGFGSGTVPTLREIIVAKSGMAEVNYQPNNGYVETYMFGGRFELHSVSGDLWSHFGIVGLLCAAGVLVLIVRGISGAIARNAASAVLVYVGSKCVWNLFFGPLSSSVSLLVLGVGLALVTQAERRPTRVPRSTR